MISRRSATTRLAHMSMPTCIARKATNRTPNIGIAALGAAPSVLTLDAEWEELARTLLEQG